jgi:HNH endonuclease
MDSPHSAATISNPRRIYSAVNQCIYCGRSASSQVALTDEHIIPLSLGGNFILPKASCFRCLKRINRFETIMFEAMLQSARHHMGIVGRNKIKKRDRLSVKLINGPSQTTLSVNVDDHPGILVTPELSEMPGMLLGRGLVDAPGPLFKVGLTGMHEDIGRRVRQFGNNQINFTRPFSSLDLFQMLAKIGHAYAAAELGIAGFDPVLGPLILDGDESIATHYIGGEQDGGEPEGQLHRICLVPQLQSSVVLVRLRLFAHVARSPVYYMVCGHRSAGERQSPPAECQNSLRLCG